MKSNDYLAIICRETNPRTGEIAVYEIKTTVDDRLIGILKIRARTNAELRYFAVPRVRWESKYGEDYRYVLGKTEVTQEDLKLIGGIVEI